VTVSGNVYFSGNTMTYISGIVNASGCTLNLQNITGNILNVSGIVWGNVNTTGVVTLLSDLNISGNLAATNTLDGFNVNVKGNLTSTSIGGTSTIVLTGTGTWTASGNTFINVTINTSGTITILGTITYSRTLKYINGKVIAKNSTMSFSNLTVLINCHRINFDRVVIASNVTITMNEFFSGSPNLKTTISPSSTTNYTIVFQDGFEKISKFVNISGCTLSRPQQLLVITNSKKSSTNRGVRYINQSPNGTPEGKPSTPTQTTFSTAGLLSDPNMR
jgi:hypothetical protein